MVFLCWGTFLSSPIEYKVKGQGHVGFCVLFVCMILLEPVVLHLRNVARPGPRAVLSLEQGLTFLLQ